MTRRLRRFMRLYTALWLGLFPVVLAYLWLRGRRDRRYRANIAERFGVYQTPLPGAVWVHAVSLGELRSAVPVINALLARGERVVTTHFTPAGRSEAERIFAADIAAGRLVATWVPLEYAFCFNRFFADFKPKFGLVMEIEVWPRMILSAETSGVPLFLCNAQYPKKSFARDQTKSRWRADLHRHLAGALVKSEVQRARFAKAGVPDIAVTGELRFDQPVPEPLIAAGLRWKKTLGDRLVVALPSVVAGEDETYLRVIADLRGAEAPLFIYIPRAPERFQETADIIEKSGLSFAKRSEVFDDALKGAPPADIDVLLGDSFGEMYFYLAACDVAVIGGSFVEKGAHNISEPLVLGKPCIVGPHVWTIEFPVVEALAAGVVSQVSDAETLSNQLKALDFPSADAAKSFAQTQLGATDRTIEALLDRGLISP